MAKKSEFDQLMADRRRAQKHKELARFYNLCSLFGNDWAMFYVILGARMTGKSYAVMEYILKQHKKKKNVLSYWMRISETSTRTLLVDKAKNLVDPDLARKYNLEIRVKGGTVYDRDRQLMTVIPLSQFAKQKGIAYFDKDFDGETIIVLDEFQLEKGEKRTSFDILYNFIGMIENIARTRKKGLHVILLGNTLEEASSILKAFNFLPEKFGRFKLRSKKCVIDNLEPTAEYLKDRYGSAADILGGKGMSNYTNEIRKDLKVIKKGRFKSPEKIIKFAKGQDHWYTLWEDGVIRRWRGESVKPDNVIAMRRYIDEFFDMDLAKSIIERNDAQALYYHTLIDQSYFVEELKQLPYGRA